MLNKVTLKSKKTHDVLTILTIGLFIGVLYPALNKDDNMTSVINGLIIGLTGSGFIAFNEIIFNPKYIRQLSFRLVMIYKSVVYLTYFLFIIPLIVTLSRSFEQKISPLEFIDNGGLHQFIFEEDFHVIMTYALVATVLFIFTYQMSRKMGQGVMWSFISGKYHKPKKEVRIFLFIDLNDSTAIAEKIGDIDYNKFLNVFFFDITDSILNNYGKIYRYVGDEIVVSWKIEKGLKNLNFLNTFFQAKKALEKNNKGHIEKYGITPAFTASYNYGEVIVGEIGQIKSQISFIGNAMYETAAIEKSCGRFDTDLLISDGLLEKIELPKNYISIKKGEVEIEGLSTISVSTIDIT